MKNDRLRLIEKQEIKKLLQEKTKCSGIRLPRDIELTSRNGVLTAFVSNPTQNMQADGAAFEGWIVAMKRWLPELAQKVILGFSVPADLQETHTGNTRFCHFNRFLYRVKRFSDIFSDWFYADAAVAGYVTNFMSWLGQNRSLLNHSLKTRKPVPETERMERQVETWLVFGEGKENLCVLWDIDPATLWNQLPVGIFSKNIERENAVFPRGAGAIDMWGIGKDDSTLHIVELKYGHNIKIGVISEILFYSFLIFDARVSDKGLFEMGRYGDAPYTPDWVMFQHPGRAFKQLRAHILAEDYHPLFDEEVVNLLAGGLSRLGIGFDRACYDYEAKTLKGLC